MTNITDIFAPSCKPIETHYGGYRFRSRREARWAVFFDVLGLTYEYEKEGFNLPSGKYLPDFWLPDWKMWVEIKGNNPSEYEKQLAFELFEKTSFACAIFTKPSEYGRLFCLECTESSCGILNSSMVSFCWNCEECSPYILIRDYSGKKRSFHSYNGEITYKNFTNESSWEISENEPHIHNAEKAFNYARFEFAR